MIINNLELIKPFLKFESNDIYYHLQILKRKKDCNDHNKGKNNNARCLRTYYVRSIEYLDEVFNEIKILCKSHQARAYINLNAKSYQRTAYIMNEKVAQRMKNNQFEYIYRSYESAAGTSDVNVGEKRWIVDIDEKEISPLLLNHIEFHCDPISKNCSDFLKLEVDYFDSKIYTKIPTKSGWHLITKPFNVDQFKQRYNGMDIQKNNPTLLYYENDTL